ncbi:MAG: chorismate-binding protein, partial [Flavobacteriales bacterium]
MSDNAQTMTEGPLVLFHRPGSAVLERLVPGMDGPVRFRMHPWEGADQHVDLIVEGRLETLTRLDTPHQREILREATTVEGTARQDHLDRIALALETIENSPLEKVVLSSRLSVRVDGLEFDAIVRQLAAAHPNCFNWLLHHEEIGTWFGSSPEPLV